MEYKVSCQRIMFDTYQCSQLNDYKFYEILKSVKLIVPNRVWSINELTDEEIRDLHYELDYVHENERWWEQEPLKTLDLSFNSLAIIDSKIECLSELTTLLVSIKVTTKH